MACGSRDDFVVSDGARTSGRSPCPPPGWGVQGGDTAVTARRRFFGGGRVPRVSITAYLILSRKRLRKPPGMCVKLLVSYGTLAGRDGETARVSHALQRSVRERNRA